MTLSLVEVAGTNFRTTRDADMQNDHMMRNLGLRSRFAPARLAIARSLSLPNPPAIGTDADDDPGKTIKGDTLFGTGSDLATWTALLIEHAGLEQATRKDLAALVAAHWRRGMEILVREWEESESDLQRFIGRVIENAGLPVSGAKRGFGKGIASDQVAKAAAIRVRIGEVGTDLGTEEILEWGVNAPGGSPHVAIMGSVGTGKTRTARALLEQIQSQVRVPVLAFDLKGDLRDDKRLLESIGATVIDVPRQPIPMDVLALPTDDESDRKFVAARFQESFKRIKQGGFGANQMDALREATIQALRSKHPCRIEDIRDTLKRVYAQRDMKPDGASAAFNQLCDFRLFEPKQPPAEFFSNSWVLTFPSASEETRKMVSYVVLDALDRWLNALDDAPTDSAGNRALRSIVLIDEAHRLLGLKQQALANLVRMSRSKGGLVMLVSQKPDDFENEDDDFVSDVGLFVCFRTNARPGPAQRVLREKALSDLPDGVCIARIGSRPPARIKAWSAATDAVRN